MRQTSILIIFLVAFLEYVSFGILLPMLPFYASSFGASAWGYAWLMVTFSGVQFLASPIWGKVSDHLGRRAVLLLSLAGSALSLGLLGVSGSIEWLFISRALAGAFGATLSIAYSSVTDIASDSERPKALGMLAAGSGLGMIFGPAIGGYLSRYGFLVPVLAAACLTTFNLIFAFFKVDEPRLGTEARSKYRYKRFDADTFRLALEDPRTRLASILYFLATFMIAQLEAVFAMYLLQRYQYGAEVTGLLLALIGVVIITVQLTLLPRFSEKYGAIPIALVGALIYSLGLTGMILSQSAVTLVSFLLIVALGQSLLTPVLVDLAYAGTSSQRRAISMGVFRSFGSVARLLAPPIAGWAFDHVSWRAPFITAAAAALLAAITALIWIVLPSRVSQLADAEHNPYLEG